ncbi:MAG: hypothetical protein H7Z14_18625 [Anaerolineae bacterium]|nr:hypothetical protein [Phycisphaerae bacterium]
MKFQRHALPAIVLAIMVVGCQPDRPMETSPNRAIPRNAIYAKQGVGRLWFQATDPGVAYIYDADTTQFVFAAAMQKNQRLVIEPTKDRATVEGKPVFEKPMQRKHTHRIYFEPFGKLPPPEKPPAPLEPISPKASTAPTAP